jgi:hypothetical protein
MTPVATDPLIEVFKEQRLFVEFHGASVVRRPVTLVWQRFKKLGVSFLVYQYEGHDD